MGKKRCNFYAVVVGHQPGFYTSADDAVKQTSGYRNSLSRGFKTLQDAQEWFNQQITQIEQTTPDVRRGKKRKKNKNKTAATGAKKMKMDADENDPPKSKSKRVLEAEARKEVMCRQIDHSNKGFQILIKSDDFNVDWDLKSPLPIPRIKLDKYGLGYRKSYFPDRKITQNTKSQPVQPKFISFVSAGLFQPSSSKSL